MLIADYKSIGLSAAQNHRLRSYLKSLTVDRTKVVFDKPMYLSLIKSCRNRKEIETVRAYLNSLKDPEGWPFSRSLYQFSKLRESVTAFKGANHSPFRWNRNYQAAKDRLIQLVQGSKLQPLTYHTDQDLLDALPKTNTHSGWTYILTGRKSKGDNMDGIYARYLVFEDQSLKNGTCARPIIPGIRTQASGEFDEQGGLTHTCKHKTRMVAMIDMMQILMECKFAKPLQNALSKLPFYAGGKDDSTISGHIFKMRRKYNHYISLDYSNFDQSVSSWLIQDVFEILSYAFKSMTDAEKRCWVVIQNDFINKVYIMPDEVVEVHKGIPSGSMFTQIVGSLVNFLIIDTYTRAVGGYCDMLVMGDDNLCYSSKQIDAKLISTYVKKNFGMFINPDKTSTGDGYTCPKFLSRSWTPRGQYRNPRILLSKLLFPEKFRRYDKEKITPEHVLYGYYLAYKPSMEEVLSNEYLRNFHDCLDKGEWTAKYLPGIIRYMQMYEGRKQVRR